MQKVLGLAVALLAVVAAGCGGDDNSADTGGSAGMSSSGGMNGAAGDAGQDTGEPARSEGAASIQLAESTCIEQTNWVLPDENDPVTATERGMAAVDGRPEEYPFIDCLVHGSGGVWDFEASIITRDITMTFYCWFEPDVPCEGSIQLAFPGIRQDISSTQAGPCVYTVIDIAEGSIWANVECASTRERDLTECGAATVYLAFDHCDTSRAAYLRL
jgi:hypothetical protein